MKFSAIYLAALTLVSGAAAADPKNCKFNVLNGSGINVANGCCDVTKKQVTVSPFTVSCTESCGLAIVSGGDPTFSLQNAGRC
ncbi:hypothetical protein MCOR27_003818 [Pyricularia oryzae]|uniref:Uncharacterized protein n=4 Tax=Pyricularia TaxID=48558 RepID=A0ABQ8N9T6_PYRGI|nr:hypothetical protein MGCH7_ch7g952 [Pyricularia oryzae 70-15]ELQ34171.1 hypothetical protein OOU_Y34scaffold00791g7 [Pyricularia oryzae Y34]KAH8846610.1 hypothetical protein MCOR01_000066 [Pyricularia oryzae]KAI6293234.1 hypothetical protein MCOR33_009292 [Pyricularia grisea]KAI6282228.1 hypothetical protein MCOR27_003818 [Pyricularia oryzae]